jgi:hypothetical protein
MTRSFSEIENALECVNGVPVSGGKPAVYFAREAAETDLSKIRESSRAKRRGPRSLL